MLALVSVANAVTPPEIVLTRVDPAIPAIRGDSRTSIEIRDPAEDLMLFDQQGTPFLRMTKEGVFERNSKGAFAAVRKENFFYLHDGHVGAAVLERKSLPYPWRIQGTYGGKPFVMEGTLIPAGTRADGSRPAGGLVGFSVMSIAGLAVLVIGGAIGLAFLVKGFLKQ